MWHKLRALWFLCHALRWYDSLAWASLSLMMALGVYRGLSPDRARELVMNLCDESSFLEDMPVGRVRDAIIRAEPPVRHPWLLHHLERQLSDLQDSLGQEGEDASDEA